MKKGFVRWSSIALAFALAAGVGAACGDDDAQSPHDGGDSGDGAVSAVEQCNTLVTALCSRAVTCTVYTSVAACRTDLAPSLNCGAAVGVSPTYSACMDAVPSIDCGVFTGSASLPTSCQSVILM